MCIICDLTIQDSLVPCNSLHMAVARNQGILDPNVCTGNSVGQRKGTAKAHHEDRIYPDPSGGSFIGAPSGIPLGSLSCDTFRALTYRADGNLVFPSFFLTCATVTQVAKVSILDKIAPNITLQAQIDERRCICIKQHGSDRGEYKPVCGQCRDPCALRFIPRNSVEYLQKLTLGENAVSEVSTYSNRS